MPEKEPIARRLRDAKPGITCRVGTSQQDELSGVENSIDELNKMNTFTVRLGARKVFWTCIVLLQMAYASSIVYSLVYLNGWTCAGSIAAHGAVALLILGRALRTDLTSETKIYDCYMDIWKAFYFEYLLIPLFAVAV